MRSRTTKSVIILVMMVLITSMSVITADMTPNSQDSIISGERGNSIQQQSTMRISEDTLNGILNPLEVEQQGYITSGNLETRTDINPLTTYNHSIDVERDWMASKAQALVWDLNRLYAVNGSFLEGYPGQNILDPSVSISYYPLGWNATAYNPNPAQTQRATYDNTGRTYVTVQNEGVKIGPSGKKYDHIAGTKIYWTQLFSNTPHTDNFLLSFDYLYSLGPLGLAAPGNCSLVVLINDTRVWNVSLPTLESRGIWYSVNDYPVNIPSAGDILNISIGLEVDEYMDLNADADYNLDGFSDGIANTVYITAFLDDILFTGNSSPSFQQVDMQLSVNSESQPILGSAGSGSATIVNQSYWRTTPLTVQISANTSVSFNYELRLLSHRFTNTSSSSGMQVDGVSYSISFNQNPEFTAHTYLGSLGEYENLSLIIRYPSDWNNLTVYDPFLVNVTSQCFIGMNEAWIPASLTSRLGWWNIDFSAPNYVQNIETQKLSGGGWEIADIFRSSNKTQTSISVGTIDSTPQFLDTVGVKIKYPNGTLWVEEVVSGGIDGNINSSTFVLGPQNTTAGVWSVEAQWQNGTEIGYAFTNFEMYHKTLLEPISPLIETESGEVISNFIWFKDADNGEYILNNAASVIANWSGSVVEFTPNEFRNRWDADFNTTLIDGGVYTVVVNASLEYYDDAQCSFEIRNILIDNSLSLHQNTVDINLRSPYNVTFEYKDRFGIGIDGASVAVHVSENQDGLIWGEPTQTGLGNYSLDLLPIESGTYIITIYAWKTYYSNATDTLALTVGNLGSNMTILNGTGAIGHIDSAYRLVILFKNSTGYGLENASISIISSTPSIGVNYSDTIEEGSGLYSIELTPSAAGTYIFLIRAEIMNHQVQIGSFSLNVQKITSKIVLVNTPSLVSIDQSCIAVFNFTSEEGDAIENAVIVPDNPPDNLDFSEFEELGNGLYQIIITPQMIKSYQVLFKATSNNYLDASVGFSLVVTSIPTTATVVGEILDRQIYYNEEMTFDLMFVRTDLMENVTGANIVISASGIQQLNYSISEVGEIYSIRIKGEKIGIWGISIEISKENCDSAFLNFKLEVETINTLVNVIDEPTLIELNQTYTFTFNYTSALSGEGIDDAEFAINTNLEGPYSKDNIQGGMYLIRIAPEHIGQVSMTISFQKLGYQRQEMTLNFTVTKISASITMSVERLDFHQLQPLECQFYLNIASTNEPLSGAVLTYRLYHGNDLIQTDNLQETSPGSGVYSLYIGNQPWIGDNGYSLSIILDNPDYKLEGDTYNVDIFDAPMTLDEAFGLFMPPALLLIAIGSVIGVSYRVNKKRRAEMFQKALATKKRFDDADNLIGIIVLHKKSGLSIYSTTLKGGFEESMISAFITAITQFRGEVDKSDNDWNWEVVPISDIIRIVPTKNLICAFITVSPASMAQETKMAEYSRAVGMTFDNDLEDTPFETLDDNSVMILDNYFEEIMDGFLFHYYKRGTSKAFPKQFKCLEEKLLETGTQECARPIYLARELTDCGISEAEGCVKVIEAIEQELIVPCQDPEIHSHDSIDWALFEDE